MTNKINNTNFFILFLLFFLLVVSKVIDHPPNFSPVISIVIISAFLISNYLLLSLTILFSMIVSDLIVGYYSGMSIVYLTLIFISITVKKISKRLDYLSINILSLYSSILFYLVTNPLHAIVEKKSIINFFELKVTLIQGLPFFLILFYQLFFIATF